MNDRTLRPAAGEHFDYYTQYTRLVGDGDILSTLRAQHRETQVLLAGISEAHGLYRPAPAEWSVKQVLGHLVDTERTFAYRALVFARADSAALPSMEPDPYVANGNFDARTVADLAEEFAHLRAATVLMLNGLSDEAWSRGGVASGARVTVRALAWIIAGHETHHVISLKEKYRV